MPRPTPRPEPVTMITLPSTACIARRVAIDHRRRLRVDAWWLTVTPGYGPPHERHARRSRRARHRRRQRHRPGHRARGRGARRRGRSRSTATRPGSTRPSRWSRDAGGTAIALRPTSSDEAAVQDAVVARPSSEFGRLDGVVTAAGHLRRPRPPAAGRRDASRPSTTCSPSTSPARSSRSSTPSRTSSATRAQPRSSVVTIASTAGLRGHGYGAGYTASKGGVVALTRLVAVQYGPHGVRANCICPGAVDTPMAGGVWDSDEARARMKRAVPLGVVAQAGGHRVGRRLPALARRAPPHGPDHGRRRRHDRIMNRRT